MKTKDILKGVLVAGLVLAPVPVLAADAAGEIATAETHGFDVLLTGDKHMRYQQSLAEPVQSWSVKRSAKAVNYAGYTRDATNEINHLFKPLENPQIPIYVFPHVALISDEQLLKPGYTTAFFLYKQNQFALPSELY